MIPKNLILIGIDWADAKHDFHLVAPDGTVQSGVFAQSPEAIKQQLLTWRTDYPAATFAIGVESTKGALINGLLEYEDVSIYPINPAALAYLRKSHRHGGGKNDTVDALRIAEFLLERFDQLKPLQQDSPLTRELAALSQERRGAVDDRADLSNKLTALLKQYFPAVLQFEAAKPYATFLLKFLAKYPTLEAAQAAGETELRSFFHGVKMKRKADTLAKLICNAQPLTTDDVTLRTQQRNAALIVDQLQVLNSHIRSYERSLKKLLPQHSNYTLAAALPGIATNTQARLIAAMGDGHGRYATAASLQCASGIAPLTVQSGSRKFVHSRWACTKFLRQTFHELAGLTINESRWAKAYFEDQKSKGKGASTAKRALAYKWQRIIIRCWQTGEPYNEDHYIERLKSTGSPLYAKIQDLVI